MRFFAVLREQAGRDGQEIPAGDTVGQAFAALRAEHGFTLPPDIVRFAIGGRFVGAETVIASGDELVIIPPVAGG